MQGLGNLKATRTPPRGITEDNDILLIGKLWPTALPTAVRPLRGLRKIIRQLQSFTRLAMLQHPEPEEMRCDQVRAAGLPDGPLQTFS